MSDYDLVVIGGGPAGQKAAVQGAKAGARVLLIERSKSAGGACVRYGTIPSKTLRETALSLGKFRKLTAHLMQVDLP
ncbi:MAG: Soluble pyridine nucleotide transhydrogenase, partial [Pseudomonadota bacterium]